MNTLVSRNVDQANQSAELDDLMLAMDVVDTLRHQQSLVDHALSADVREAALRNRIRQIYLDQGIEVSDEVIANGVRALREERFAYKAPPGGFKTWLAKCYVGRSRAYKPLVALCAAIGVWWGANFAFVTLPEQRALTDSMQAYNSAVAETHSGLVSVRNRLTSAKQTLKNMPQAASEFRDVVPTVQAEIESDIAESQQLQANIATLNATTYTDIGDYQPEAEQATGSLRIQQQALAQLRTRVDKVESNVKLLKAYASLPHEITELTSAVINIGKEPAVTMAANAAAENAIAALKARDIAGAVAAKASLENLLNEVKSDYKILLVSQPGEKTGVWRYPEQNNKARNYYLIVEAVTADGSRLTRAIVSEEDGKTYHVSRWGMRVDERTYNAVAADKQDDGIVQNRTFGIKARGFINPTYSMNTTGASIVSW